MNLPLSDAKLLRNGAYVDGNWIESTPHGSYALRNPATGEIPAELPRLK
jgi:succinate-semialdehyde dehydrogenase / glutarate-semialdehyde dehydrogenase